MRYLVVLYLLVTTVLSGLFLYEQFLAQERKEHTPLSQDADTPKERPLQKYAFTRLQQAHQEGAFVPEGFRIQEEIEQDDDAFSAYIAVLETAEGDVTGLLHVPSESIDADATPYLVLFRGFVNPSVYETGIGSRPIATQLATAGYVTFSPDFLGYGDSDNPSENPMEERFQAYPTALAALQAGDLIEQAIAEETDSSLSIDADRIGIWGHSNGGHIALSVLAITQEPYPTVLWAPVSKPFPYSILFYTDEYEDEGFGLRKLIADFEQDYDVQQYSTNTYYDQITAPIQIHQGEDDRPVPYWWSEELAVDLNDTDDAEAELFIYPNSDHNLAPDGWGTAAGRTVSFFTEQFEL